MLYREIIAVCSQIHTEHINILCEQNVEFVSVKHGGTYSYHYALKGHVTGSCLTRRRHTTVCGSVSEARHLSVRVARPVPTQRNCL